MKEVNKTFFWHLASRADFHLVLDSDVTGTVWEKHSRISSYSDILFTVYIVHYTYMYKRSLSKKKDDTDKPRAFENHLTITCCYSS